MAEHDIAPLGEIHRIANWEYPDAATRAAATGFIPADLGKWAKQLDDGSYWELVDDSPVTWEQRTGGGGALADDSVTNAKLANMAQATIKGRAAGAGTGDPTDLSGTQATAILDAVVGDSGAGGTKGLVPAPGAGDAAAGKYLDAAGAFSVPPGTGGGGGSFSGTSAFRLLPFDQLPSSDVGAVVGANEVYVIKFFLPMELVVASIHFAVNTANAGSNVAVGVYSDDGNTKHIDSGAVSGATTGTKSVTLGSPVTLPSGFYWFAWTATDSTVRLSAIQTTTTWYGMVIAGTLQEGKGANASSSGVLPATLGAIGTSGQTPVPIAKLQG